MASKRDEMLIRIDERVKVLPEMHDAMTKLGKRVERNGESIRWLTWGVRLGYVSLAGMLVYLWKGA